MKVKSVKCPECGATFEIKDGKMLKYCQYCGTVLEYDDGVLRTEHTERTVDEAKIRELELQYQEDKEIRERNAGKNPFVYMFMLMGFLFMMLIVTALLKRCGIYL